LGPLRDTDPALRAAEVARGVGLESLPDGGGAVWVHGLMTFCWDGGDEAGRRLAAVQLAELKAATQQQRVTRPRKCG
jgi:hypothetical protein